MQKFHTFERLSLLQWAVKKEGNVFSVCICHSLHCYAFVFGDMCYTQVAENVFLGLDLSALSSQEAVLVSAHTVFIKHQLQDYWDMRCIVGFIRGSFTYCGLSGCVCVNLCVHVSQ